MCQSNGEWHLSLPECHSRLTEASTEIFSLVDVVIDVFYFSFLFAVIDCGKPRSLLNGGVRQVSGRDNQHRSVIQYHCNEPFYAFLGGVNGEIIFFLF